MDIHTQVFYPFINVYMRLKPDRSFKIPVFKCLESFINVCKQIYPFISEFARQITRQIPICEHDSTNKQIVEKFVCGYIQTSKG